MAQPLLSVVIATKDREQYCIAAIDSILSYQDERIEIAIADNSATMQVKEYVEQLNHPAVKYTYDAVPVSFVSNFNRAMNLTTGEYVILIGDDDTILANCVNWAQWMKETAIDSLSSANPIDYFWPIDNDPKFSTGLLLCSENITFDVKKCDNDQNLKAFMNNGTIAYQSYNLPRVYHGIVSKKAMDRVRETTGHYFGGISPDLYSTIALSLYLESNYIVNAPFSVFGACKASGTYGVIAKQHIGHIKDAPHLKYSPDYELDPAIPKIYSAYVVWTESLLKALRENRREDLIREINFPLFYAHVNDEFMVMDKRYLGLLRDELQSCFRHRQFGVDEINQFNKHKKHLNYINKKHKVKSLLLRTLQKLGLAGKDNHVVSKDNLLHIKDVIAYVSDKIDMNRLPQL